MERLEALIAQYEAAIFAGDRLEIDRLCQEVEQEADVIGYTNHQRLHALHTAAEQAMGE